MKSETEYIVPTYIYVLLSTLVVAVGIGIFRAEWSTVFISLLTLGVSLYAIRLRARLDVHIPSAFLTAAILFVYATLFLGEVGDFYERFWWWDVVLHTGSAIGFGLIGAIILITLFWSGRVASSPILTAVFVFAFAVAIGAVWEIFEFTMDQLFGLSMQKSGLVDTMTDLIVDCIGALVAAGATYVYLTKGKQSALTGVLEEAVEKNKST